MGTLYTIYGYLCLITNEWYVGRTCKTQEKRAGKNGMNYILQWGKFGQAISKYGWDNFEYHILETTEDKELSWELEKKWILLKDSVQNGFNSSYGGRGSLGCNRRKVLQYTIDGQIVAEYPSLMEAEKMTGTNIGNIISCCNGKYKSAGGSIWKYA